MQDRFKFRFFDVENKKMYDVKNICFVGEPTVTLDYKPVIKKQIYKGYLMQCTGLSDKNGKEIYEGDIVKYFCPAEYCSDGLHKCQECYSGENGSVYYDEDLAMYEYISKSDQCPLTDNIRTEEDLEVIGNIYENPELLKD